MSNKIYLKGAGRHEEAVAASAISPGDLIALGSAGTVAVHGTEGGIAERAFAVEDALQGKTKTDAYAAGAVVSFVLACPGDELYAFLKDGQTVAKGDALISAGDGTLIKDGQEASATVVKQRVAIALEAKVLTASADVDTLIKVRVL